jgi:hypothetical protein
MVAGCEAAQETRAAASTSTTARGRLPSRADRTSSPQTCPGATPRLCNTGLAPTDPTAGEDTVDVANWAGSIPQASGLAPRVRIGWNR